jgi:hypothetical protein
MVFNTTFNNISAVSWRSILLVEGGGGVVCRRVRTSILTESTGKRNRKDVLKNYNKNKN